MAEVAEAWPARFGYRKKSSLSSLTSPSNPLTIRPSTPNPPSVLSASAAQVGRLVRELAAANADRQALEEALAGAEEALTIDAQGFNKRE